MIQSQSVYGTINIVNGNQEYQFQTLLVMNMRNRYSIMINILESHFVTSFNNNIMDLISLDEFRIDFILIIRLFNVYTYSTSIDNASQHQNLIGLSVHASTRKMSWTATNDKFK